MRKRIVFLGGSIIIHLIASHFINQARFAYIGNADLRWLILLLGIPMSVLYCGIGYQIGGIVCENKRWVTVGRFIRIASIWLFCVQSIVIVINCFHPFLHKYLFKS